METDINTIGDNSSTRQWAVDATSRRNKSRRPRIRTVLLWTVFLVAAYSLHNYMFNGSLGYHVFTRGVRDFRSQNLRGISAAYLAHPIAGCDFSGADLTEAHLTGVKFEHCQFRVASFKGALLHSVRFEGCDLKGADFRNGNFGFSVKDSSLIGAKFNNSSLKRINFQNQDLRNADFTGADLTDANLNGTDLTGADLRGANLANCSLDGTRQLDIKKDEKTIWPASRSKSRK